MYEKVNILGLGIDLPDKLASGFLKKVVWHSKKMRLYGFVYNNTAACRETSSVLHRSIEQETKDLIDETTLVRADHLRESSNCAGKYLFPGLDYKYVDGADGMVCSTQIPQNQIGIEHKRQLTEKERMRLLADALRKNPQVIRNDIKVEEYQFKEIKSDVCPFTGGGDLFIRHHNSICVCLANQLDDAVIDTNDPESPATIEGNIRGPSVLECKRQTTQDQTHINLQLKANMMLALCHHFYNILADTSPLQIQQRLGEVAELSGYGVTFGCSTRLEVYKLVMKFDGNTCEFYKRFTYPPAPAMGHYLNGALSYVIRRISTIKPTEN